MKKQYVKCDLCKKVKIWNDNPLCKCGGIFFRMKDEEVDKWYFDKYGKLPKI